MRQHHERTLYLRLHHRARMGRRLSYGQPTTPLVRTRPGLQTWNSTPVSSLRSNRWTVRSPCAPRRSLGRRRQYRNRRQPLWRISLLVTWPSMLTFTPPSLCLESGRTSSTPVHLQDDRNNLRRTDRLSLLSWNPGPARGSWDAFIGRIVGPWRISAFQEGADFELHPALTASFAVTSLRGRATLFSRNTFECNVGSKHLYIPDTGSADSALGTVVASGRLRGPIRGWQKSLCHHEQPHQQHLRQSFCHLRQLDTDDS